jgi:hypothetical protein
MIENEADVHACSVTKLLRIGLSQSLHLMMPISVVSGCAPKSFISCADSHDVGGDGSDVGSSFGDAVSHEKGDGGALVLGFRVGIWGVELHVTWISGGLRHIYCERSDYHARRSGTSDQSSS